LWQLLLLLLPLLHVERVHVLLTTHATCLACQHLRLHVGEATRHCSSSPGLLLLLQLCGLLHLRHPRKRILAARELLGRWGQHECYCCGCCCSCSGCICGHGQPGSFVELLGSNTRSGSKQSSTCSVHAN
jgi:hypothetical protein